MKNKKKGKKKIENKDNYRKYILLGIGFICILFIIWIIFRNDSARILKSEYKMNEPGYLDKINVSLKKAIYINNQTGVEVTFEITNKTNNTITIVPDQYFKFYDINSVQIPNKYTANDKIVKKDETILYTLQYDVTQKELYEIYFYSQVVENNIKFSFTSNQIEAESITNIKNIGETLK